MGAIKRALVSVSDKAGIVDFVSGLHELGVEIISTGGTGEMLEKGGIPVRRIEDVTGFPEMLDGRVKTLHPKVHGGLLNIRDNAEHRKAVEEHGIEDIDLVAVNLYPFEQAIAKEGVALEEAIENIDIGGPSMLRSAAKNWKYVTVVVEASDYGRVLSEMREKGGETSEGTRFELAAKAFAHTARYDCLIADYLEHYDRDPLAPPKTLRIIAPRSISLRYGENPHQRAAFYTLIRPQDLKSVRNSNGTAVEACVGSARLLSGKELSFNNILDAHAALELARDFDQPACSVIKHTNPCGMAVADSLSAACERAFAGDPVSAFGSIVGTNAAVDEETAEVIAAQPFVEAVIAPEFAPEALEVLQMKPKWGKNVRLLAVGDLRARDPRESSLRKVGGGLLWQSRDIGTSDLDSLETVTDTQLTDDDLRSLRFAWMVARRVKSNCIVLAKEQAVVGVGAGQMSRVDSTIIAIRKAGDRAAGAVMASDAFFPFPDAIEKAAAAGIKAIIQPGGSKGDKKAIAACNKQGIAMVFTGQRHFLH